MKKQICMMVATMMAAVAPTGCSGGAEETTVAPATAKTAAETTQVPAAGGEAEAESLAGETMAVRAGEFAKILVTTTASLKNTYEGELIPMFQERYPNVIVKNTYDSPGKSQTQVEEGLEADVFMSTVTKQMTVLGEEGMIEPDVVTNLLENGVVLIVLAGSGVGFEKSEGIERAESIALGDPASVPVEQYAQETLTSLDIWDEIQDEISLGTSVAEVPSQVTTSNANVGIVYTTDAAGMVDQVQTVVEVPEGSLGGKVVYLVAIVKNTAHAEEAKNFVEFLKTSETMKIFEEYGLTKGG